MPYVPDHCRAVRDACVRGPRAGEKVLTVRQPWAWLLVEGYKGFENRSKPTSHRGLLWIHSAASASEVKDADADNGLFFIPASHRPESVEALPRGKVIGAVWLDACYHEDDCPNYVWQSVHASGPYLWEVSGWCAVKRPIAAKGALGLWTWK